ncbi:MAG: hypothetical protein M1838_006147 [Thelocarpon superellum]|nr:MAG: hypothetical protein M1838_006147 [Thelocarpon superellum]
MAPPPKNERYYLKPTKVKEPDEWPEFLLDEVLVTDGRQKPISLLEATVNNGVVVHGLLRKVKDEDEDLVRHEISETGNPIFLPNVELFAYQRDMDGTIDFWAASKSGWFKMVGPSKAYQSVYDDMEQAVTLLRFLEGLHPEEPPNSRGSLYPTLDEIFEEVCSSSPS